MDATSLIVCTGQVNTAMVCCDAEMCHLILRECFAHSRDVILPAFI